MKLGLYVAVMALGLAGCGGIDFLEAGKTTTTEPMSAESVKEKGLVDNPLIAESSGEKKSAPLTKEQCSEKYPVVVGQLSQRQTCVNESATESLGKFTAKQRGIISDCAEKLLTLAERADEGEVAMDVYKKEKQELRTTCNTSIRMAGATTVTGAKATKANTPKPSSTKTSAGKDASSKTKAAIAKKSSP